mgnify:CR=1 FL=1
MKRQWQKGAGDLDGIVILAVLVVIMLTSVVGSKNSSEQSNSGLNWAPGVTVNSSGTNSGGSEISGTLVATSDYKNSIWIGGGNAPYAYQAYEEYITLENHSRNPVNITGWQLRNGKDERPVYLGSNLQRFSADVAVIPQATNVLSPTGNSTLQDVVLQDGERAVINTGKLNVQTPYTITSFKENMCTGYIEALPDYAFSPPLNQNCPRPDLEPGLQNMDVECRGFIRTLSSCRTPEFNNKDRDGQPCSTCVNGQILSNQCATFIKQHYNYQGCLIYHSGDTNFSGKTWRLFLGRGWEMWAKEYETIELYDRLGQLVNFQNY